MWWGARFEGDENELLMDVQCDLYWENVRTIFCKARDAFIRAEDLLDVSTQLGAAVRQMEGFDHRTLQDAHDLIAAGFRKLHPELGQLHLSIADLPPPDEHLVRLRSEWQRFFRQQVRTLCEENLFVRAVVEATVYANSDRGMAAESELRQLLKRRYGLSGE